MAQHQSSAIQETVPKLDAGKKKCKFLLLAQNSQKEKKISFFLKPKQGIRDACSTADILDCPTAPDNAPDMPQMMPQTCPIHDPDDAPVDAPDIPLSILFDILEAPAFRKYGTRWVFSI